MALAVTHVILTIVLIDLYRDYIAPKKFPTKYVLIGGIAGLLPDIDIPIGWIMRFFTGTEVISHGTFTHSLVFPIILAFAAFLSYEVAKKPKIGLLLGVVAFGLFFHSVLDCVFNPYMLFLPFSTAKCPFDIPQNIVIGVDAIILLLWLIHEEWSHKIRDYI